VANPAAQTAYGPMISVAIDQYYPPAQRLVQDELAFQFLPSGYQALVKLTRWPSMRSWMISLLERGAHGVWAGVLCRKRYIDDRLLEALGAGIQAVVILGAGLDTRAYNLPALGAMPVFEVDLPENVAYKKALLQKLYGSIPAHVTLVPLDFDRQDLASGLTSQGYRLETKSFFIWEAVTQYLSEAGVQKTMRFLAQAKTGSRLVFTYVYKDFIDGTARYGLDALYETYRVNRRLWRFGLDPKGVAAFLEGYGWAEREQVGSKEYTERYLEPAGRPMPVMEIERAVYAQKR
jgi:methyltransferase (TIGR00027 family)